MASGAEHYSAAELLIAACTDKDLPAAAVQATMAMALVHSNLAIAAAQALRGYEGLPERDRKAWYEAAGAKVAPAVKPVQDAA